MASATMQVALIMTAMNNLGPNINAAKNMIKGLGATAEETQKRLDNLQRLKDSGMANIRSGIVMAAPIEEAVRQAAQFESVMKKVELANYDSTVPLALQKEQLKGLSDLALKLGADTVFSNTDAAQAQLTLLRNGMAYEDVLNGGAKAAMYLAQTAEVAPATAADAVSQITNMYQLNSSQLMQVADDMNRAANASSAGVQAIMHDMQQAGGTAHMLGLNAKDTALMLGTLHNLGLGDSSGTFLNDMLINLDKATPKARKALEEMGWLKDAQVTYTKAGTMKVIGGQNSLFDEKGGIKSAQLMVNSLRSAMAGVDLSSFYNAKGEILPAEEIDALVEKSDKLQAIKNFKDVFGVQGMRAAIALAQTGKGSYEEMAQKAEHMKNIQEQVAEMQGTMAGMFESLKGSWETLSTSSGSPILDELKGFVRWAIDATNAILAWTKAHPEATKAIMNTVGALAGYRIFAGVIKFLVGDFGKFGITIGPIASKMRGFYTTFSYFRQGSGIFRSLWSAIAFGHPIISKAGSLLGGLGSKALTAGAQVLITGARMALGWLIGLGPVGWIIGGVVLAVTAAVAAWKTNFGGFRDWIIKWASKVVELFNKVRAVFGKNPVEFDWMDQTVEDLKNAEQNPPKMLSTSDSNMTDKREFNFNIASTDPEGAANEISKIMGGPEMDKYRVSRDPRLQDSLAWPMP